MWDNRFMTMLACIAKQGTFELLPHLREQLFSIVLQRLEVTTGSTNKLRYRCRPRRWL